MKRRRALEIAALAATLLVVSGVAVAATGEAPGSTTPPTATATTPSVEQRDASKEDRELGEELERLAESWAEGGGTYGYPFWEKARERWRAGELSASLFREYATGYRDNLRLGCDLVDSTDVDADESKEIRELLVDACRERIEALRAQRRQLDVIIERAAAPAGELDADELTERADEVAKQQEIVTERLQESFAKTREAMELAQNELETRGLDRLDEDAFV